MVRRGKHPAIVATPILALLALLICPVAALAQADLDCPDFQFQEDAQAVFNEDPSDPHRLDADDDALACEDLPSRGSPPQQTVNPQEQTTPTLSPPEQTSPVEDQYGPPENAPTQPAVIAKTIPKQKGIPSGKKIIDIPKQKVLIDTGGLSLVGLGLIAALGLIALGVALLRRL